MTRSRVLVAAGGLSMALSAWLLSLRIEPFHTWFYSFIWWSWILFLSGWIESEGGESPLFGRPGEFWFFAAISAPFWFVFELWNVRLANWAYVGVPFSAGVRWAGYILAFSTVLPGVFLTAEAARLVSARFRKLPPAAQGLFSASRSRSEEPGEGPEHTRLWMALGAAGLALPLFWPRYFFPSIWGGLFFLLDPLNARAGRTSLLLQWRRREFALTGALLISGGLCGILWEFWNFWAGARWVYEIPYFSRLKIFEMPVAGYIGFLPFALECFAMVTAARGVYDRIGGKGKAAFWAACGLIAVFGSWAVDKYTVKSWGY